jgi:nitroimidazol reductase NimA-like FMN-containing flavoprotein (pyridoxamine 5'-phosphate oxidase superfamily)
VSDQEQLNTFLAEQKYMTLAVTLDDGTPWATPVRIKAREGKAFDWESKIDTEHSKAITKRPNVAISMWSPEGEGTVQFGFYAHATAEQISEPNEHGIARYQATVNKCFINDATFVKREVELA